MRKFLLLAVFLVSRFVVATAQKNAPNSSPDVKYNRMITERSHKIIAKKAAYE